MTKQEKNHNFYKPPSFAEKILQIMLSISEKEGLSGDFEEIYNDYVEEKSKARAWIWYWAQILAYFPRYISNSVYWSFQMFRNYLRIFIRNLKKHKGYSFINIAGLAIGMTCCVIAMLFVQDELSYDKFHEKKDQTYRVVTEVDIIEGQKQKTTLTKPWLAQALIEEFPEVMDAVRIGTQNRIVMSYGEKRFNENPWYVDQSFFDIFTFPLIKGNRESALDQPFTAVVTEKFAQKYFGTDDPIGKVITKDYQNDIKITGVLKEIPHNSHLQFDILISYESLKSIYNEWLYKNKYVVTYVFFGKNASIEDVKAKFHDFTKRHWGERRAKRFRYYLQPLTSIHLYSDVGVELGKTSDISYSYSYSIIAFIVLIIACINFMNLSTARASRRFREVGLRKVVGAKRIQLIRQFTGESILMALFALLVAILISIVILPYFNMLTGKHLVINFQVNWILFGGLFLLTLVVGIISGTYPALFLSAFRPVDVLKSYQPSSTKGTNVRKGLVLFQFAASLFFIVSTLVIMKQTNFMKTKDLGFDKKNVVTINVWKDKTLMKRMDIIEGEIMKNPDIVDMTAYNTEPGLGLGFGSSYQCEGFPEDQKIDMYIFFVRYDFFDFHGIDITKGRSFSREIISDQERALIINETAAKRIGWENPLGKRIIDKHEEIDGRVIGVVKDFHHSSLREEIKPCIFQWAPEYLSYFAVKIKSGRINETVKFLEEKWKEFSPNQIFHYSFLEEAIDSYYRKDKTMGLVFRLSSLLSIILACLGLFGLAMFTAEQRTKEIGIRKVLGASVPNIVFFLSKEFTKWVLLANIIAWPTAYFAMNKWLQNFAYRINIGIWTFILSAILALVISLLTVSSQSIKAALADPVKSLRYE